MMENGFSLTYVDQQDELIAHLRSALNETIARAEPAQAALAIQDSSECGIVAPSRTCPGRRGCLVELHGRNPVNVGDTIRLYQDRTEKTVLVEFVEYSSPLVTRIEGTSDDGEVTWKIRDSGTFTILKYVEGQCHS